MHRQLILAVATFILTSSNRALKLLGTSLVSLSVALKVRQTGETLIALRAGRSALVPIRSAGGGVIAAIVAAQGVAARAGNNNTLAHRVRDGVDSIEPGLAMLMEDVVSVRGSFEMGCDMQVQAIRGGE